MKKKRYYKYFLDLTNDQITNITYNMYIQVYKLYYLHGM